MDIAATQKLNYLKLYPDFELRTEPSWKMKDFNSIVIQIWAWQVQRGGDNRNNQLQVKLTNLSIKMFKGLK